MCFILNIKYCLEKTALITVPKNRKCAEQKSESLLSKHFSKVEKAMLMKLLMLNYM